MATVAKKKKVSSGFYLNQDDLDLIVAEIEQGASVSTAAAAVNCSHSTVYDHIKKDPEFARRVDTARRRSDRVVERSLYRIANREKEIPAYCTREHGEHGNRALCETCGTHVVLTVPDGDFRAIEFYLTNRQRQNWKKRWDVTIENVIPKEQVFAFVKALGEAIGEHVSDPSAKEAILDVFESAAAGLSAGPPGGAQLALPSHV